MLLLKLIHAWRCPGTKSLCQKFSRSRQFLTLGASEFKHIWADAGRTAEIYDNHRLAIMNPTRRSMVLEDWARMMLEEAGTNCEIQDPVPGKRIDGQRRSVYHAEYDFLSNGRRVEIKSSQLKWNAGSGTWEVHFGGVRFKAFDDLYLVIFSPQWADLIKHDLTTGISMSGPFSQSRGSGIKICGKAQWPEALDTILAKLCEGGNSLHVGRASIDDSAIKTLFDHHQGYSSQFYGEDPLASMSPQLRGVRVEKIVLEVDGLIHTNSTFAEPDLEYRIDGKRRGKGKASYDWIRDEKRIEVKHSQLSFVENRRYWYWYCAFHEVKRTCFDELLLVIYSPRGLDIFKHDGSYALSSSRASERIDLRAGKDELDWLSALQTIEAKLESNGCPRIAQILWDS